MTMKFECFLNLRVHSNRNLNKNQIITFPEAVLMRENSFADAILAISSSVPVLIVCIEASSSKEDEPKATKHF